MNEELLLKAKEKFPEVENLEIFQKEQKEGKRIKKINWIKAKCPKHGTFEKRYYDYLKAKYPCKKCATEAVHLEQMTISSTEEFIAKAKEIHGNKYDYSKVDFHNINEDVEIVCKKHGSFFQTPKHHIDKAGCIKCAIEKMINSRRLTTEEVIEKCKEVRGTENFDYSFVKWEGSSENIKVKCLKHNTVFDVRYYDFLGGVDCKKCAREKLSKGVSAALKGRIKITEKQKKEFVEKVKLIKPEFDYSKTEFTGTNNNVTITYNGIDYKIRAFNLLKGCEPFELSLEKRGIKKAQRRWANIEEELKETHKGKGYSYLKEEIDFIKSGKAKRDFKLHINCQRHDIFEQTFIDHRMGSGCRKCGIENRPVINISKAEKDILEFIKNFYKGEVISNYRKILNGKEVDMYFPKLNLAIEYDGLFWHNGVDNSYKFEECRKQGIRLIRITEPEWVMENMKIKYFLKSTFGVFDKRIFARKCQIKELNNEEYELFCSENSLYKDIEADIKIGLFEDGSLVQVLSLNECEIKVDCFKLGYIVVGGREKLLKYFENNYKPNRIFVYCNKDKFSGNSYIKNGFKLFSETKPETTYFYKKNYIPLVEEQIDLTDKECRKLFDYGNYIFIKEY